MENNIHMIFVDNPNPKLMENFIRHLESKEEYIVTIHRSVETGNVQRIEIKLKEQE